MANAKAVSWALSPSGSANLAAAAHTQGVGVVVAFTEARGALAHCYRFRAKRIQQTLSKYTWLQIQTSPGAVSGENRGV